VEYVPSAFWLRALEFYLSLGTADQQSFFSSAWRLYLANAWLDVIVCIAAVGTKTSVWIGGDTNGKENRGHVPSVGGAYPSAAGSGEGRVTP
jgi:hypothetical protein